MKMKISTTLSPATFMSFQNQGISGWGFYMFWSPNSFQESPHLLPRVFQLIQNQGWGLTPQAAPSILAQLWEKTLLHSEHKSHALYSPSMGLPFETQKNLNASFTWQPISYLKASLIFPTEASKPLLAFLKYKYDMIFKSLHNSSHSSPASVVTLCSEPGQLQKLLDWSSCFISKLL